MNNFPTIIYVIGYSEINVMRSFDYNVNLLSNNGHG